MKERSDFFHPSLFLKLVLRFLPASWSLQVSCASLTLYWHVFPPPDKTFNLYFYPTALVWFLGSDEKKVSEQTSVNRITDSLNNLFLYSVVLCDELKWGNDSSCVKSHSMLPVFGCIAHWDHLEMIYTWQDVQQIGAAWGLLLHPKSIFLNITENVFVLLLFGILF